MPMHSLLRARSIAWGVAGVSAAGVGGIGAIIGLEVLRVRGYTRNQSDVNVPHTGARYGAEYDGEPLRLAMLGDSLAVGVGADTDADTVGARLASELASRLQRPVQLYGVAAVGAESRHLPQQIAALAQLTATTDVAVIVVGSNDVLTRTKVNTAARFLYRAVLALRGQGCRVVVATCPDLGTVRTLIQPIRYAARLMSRRLAVAQTLVVVHAGGRPVPLGDTLGAIFWHKPKNMFAADHFHPSRLGYARAAAVLFPSVLAAAHTDSLAPVDPPLPIAARPAPESVPAP